MSLRNTAAFTSCPASPKNELLAGKQNVSVRGPTTKGGSMGTEEGAARTKGSVGCQECSRCRDQTVAGLTVGQEELEFRWIQ